MLRKKKGFHFPSLLSVCGVSEWNNVYNSRLYVCIVCVNMAFSFAHILTFYTVKINNIHISSCSLVSNWNISPYRARACSVKAHNTHTHIIQFQYERHTLKYYLPLQLETQPVLMKWNLFGFPFTCYIVCLWFLVAQSTEKKMKTKRSKMKHLNINRKIHAASSLYIRYYYSTEQINQWKHLANNNATKGGRMRAARAPPPPPHHVYFGNEWERKEGDCCC